VPESVPLGLAVNTTCAGAGIAFIPFYPLAKGRLAGRPGSPLGRIGERLHATQSQIALAWLLRRSPIMLPIPGTSSIASRSRGEPGGGFDCPQH
jgi:pyridoxine 4-dehydrogenase